MIYRENSTMNYNLLVAVHGLKLEMGNWEEQYKSMKVKFLISTFRERLHLLFGKNTDQSKIVFIRGRLFFMTCL
jgi:hypothetical protein